MKGFNLLSAILNIFRGYWSWSFILIKSKYLLTHPKCFMRALRDEILRVFKYKTYLLGCLLEGSPESGKILGYRRKYRLGCLRKRSHSASKPLTSE